VIPREKDVRLLHAHVESKDLAYGTYRYTVCARSLLHRLTLLDNPGHESPEGAVFVGTGECGFY
jgi:hypothetical protein